MPYNTRRKSLSLPLLGIHVPVTHAARAAAHRASSNSNNNNSNSSHSHGSHGPSSSAMRRSSPSPSSSSSAASTPDARHPNKKIKRSHGDESRTPAHSPSTANARNIDAAATTTPPPSPKAAHPSVEMDTSDSPVLRKVDLEGINDEIVEAVIVQLQNTNNRPHLVKELATLLLQQLRVVQHSANPCAIISSRLTTYMKRPCWSALAPCPLAKELETVHPRRTYFFLTTCPRQPLPDPSAIQFVPRAIITPPLSSTASGSEDADEERRRELSPSPEVDLSSPEFDDMDDDIPMPSTPIGSFSGRFPRARVQIPPRNYRGASPPLEKDEKEFTQTAEGLQKRKLGSLLSKAEPTDQGMELDDGSRDDSSSTLFGAESRNLTVSFAGVAAAATATLVSSPAMRPTFALNLRKDGVDADSWLKMDSILGWDRSPETVELDELDGLLNGF